jgi:hypothetical protein
MTEEQRKDFEEAAKRYADEMIGEGSEGDMHWQAVNRDFLAGCEHAVPKWIDVDANPPEVGVIVQVWRRKWHLAKRVLVGETTLWHFDDETLYTYDAPTHWAPLLPSPPSSKGN